MLDKIHAENFYIFDTCVVLDDSCIEKYSEKYKHIKAPAVFIITTAFLKEIDDLRHKSSFIKNNHDIFMSYLREYCNKGKLSKALKINPKGDYIYFHRENLKNIAAKNLELNWLDNDLIDKQLLCLAIDLKSKFKKKVTIISKDGLLKVLCTEQDVEYVYPEEKEELKPINSTGPSGNVIRSSKPFEE